LRDERCDTVKKPNNFRVISTGRSEVSAAGIDVNVTNPQFNLSLKLKGRANRDGGTVLNSRIVDGLIPDVPGKGLVAPNDKFVVVRLDLAVDCERSTIRRKEQIVLKRQRVDRGLLHGLGACNREVPPHLKSLHERQGAFVLVHREVSLQHQQVPGTELRVAVGGH
jgi:hypothetical protein